MTFVCVVGNISGLYEDIIILNKSSRECVVDLREMTTSSVSLKFPPPWSALDLQEFTLAKDEYRCICYKLDVPIYYRDRIVIKTNDQEVGAICGGGSNWKVDPANEKAKFWVNEKLGLVLYQKMPCCRRQLVYKILDFDNEHFRYINPDPKYVYGTHGSNLGVKEEWIITLPEGDNDPRPPYVERGENLEDSLRGAKEKILYDDEREQSVIEKIKECCNIC